jgi:hypothetical protein
MSGIIRRLALKAKFPMFGKIPPLFPNLGKNKPHVPNPGTAA